MNDLIDIHRVIRSFFLIVWLLFGFACSNEKNQTERTSSEKSDVKASGQTTSKSSSSNLESKSPASSSQPAPIQPGEKLPENLTVRCLVRDDKAEASYEEKKLSDLMRNQSTLLFYWVIGNQQCEEQIVLLEQFSHMPEFANLSIVALVNIREGEKLKEAKDPIFPQDVKERAELLDIHLPIILDRNYELGHLLNVQTAPSMSIIGQDNVLRIVDATSFKHRVMPGKAFGDYLREGSQNNVFPIVKRIPPHYPAQELMGQRYLDFALPDISSQDVWRIRNVLNQKKVVLLAFWRVNCPHCRREIPKLNDFYKAHSDKVEVVSVIRADTDDMKKETIGFIKDHGIGFPSLIDESNRISRLYGIISTPTTFLISPSGEIKAVFVSGIDFENVIGKRLDELLNEG